MIRLVFSLVPLLLFSCSLGLSQTKFYNYYDSGLEYIEKRTRFIEYFPHRELGVAYYNLKEFETARKELELSMAYTSSERARQYLELARNRVPPEQAAQASQAAKDAEARNRETEQRPPAIEPGPESILPAGALTYDPSKVRQVGSRLTLAVMPFQGKGESQHYVEAATDRMVTQLVELRRFKVIERAKLDEVLQEQRLQVSGVVDDRTAVDVGRVAGADAIVVGSVSVVGTTTTVGARVIETQSSEVLVARNARGDGTDLEGIEKLTENVAIMIYNELPLVQGSVITTDGDAIYIDVGSDKRIRRGSRCVAYREVGDLLNPATGALIDKKVKMLGEVQVGEVLEKASRVEPVRMEPGESIKVGDKIVVK